MVRRRSRSRSKSRSVSRVGKLAPKTRATKIYCGAVPSSSKKRAGTAEECAKASQVRLWGVRKIDAKVLQKYSKSKKEKRTKDELNGILAGLKGQISAAKKERDEEKNDANRQRIVAKIKKLVEKYNDTVLILKSL